MSKNVLNMVFRITQMLPSVSLERPFMSRWALHVSWNTLWGVSEGKGCNLHISWLPESELHCSVFLYFSNAWATRLVSLAFNQLCITNIEHCFWFNLHLPSLPIRQCIWSVLCLYWPLLKVLNRPQIQFHLTLKSAYSHLFSLFPLFIATIQFQTLSHKLLSNKYNAKLLDPISRFMYFT